MLQELALFSPGLAHKRQLVVYNKMDLPDSSDYQDIVTEFLLEQVSLPSLRCFWVVAHRVRRCCPHGICDAAPPAVANLAPATAVPTENGGASRQSFTLVLNPASSLA